MKRLLSIATALVVASFLSFPLALAGDHGRGQGGGAGNTPAHCEEDPVVDPTAGKPGQERNDRCPENPPCDADHGRPAQNSKRCAEGPPGDETCSDGVDNDGDGLVDQADPDCQEPEGPPGDPTCSDGIDNDGDGLIDGDDPDCQEEPGTEGPPGDPTCSDGIDNDGDGLVDQADPDCQEPEGPPGDPTCSDGIDNDGDGLIDGDDPDCQQNGGEDVCWARIVKIDDDGDNSEAAFALFEAGPNSCEEADDGVLPGAVPAGTVPGVRILNANTDDSSASTRIVQVGGSPGSLSVGGTDSPCGGDDRAFLVLVESGGAAVLVVPPPGTETVEVIEGVLYLTRVEDGTAQLVVLEGGDTGEFTLLESHCGPA